MTPRSADQIKWLVVRALARSDLGRAEKVAESIDSPSTVLGALMQVADALPVEARDRKLALLARAAVHAKAAKQPIAVLTIAIHLHDLGETEKAKALAAEYGGPGQGDHVNRAELRHTAGPYRSASSTEHRQGATRPQSADCKHNPVERGHWPGGGQSRRGRARAETGSPGGRTKLALSSDRLEAGIERSRRARRLVDESQQHYDSPQSYLYLAYGLKGRDPAAADEAFWKGMRGIDRLLEEGAEELSTHIGGGARDITAAGGADRPDPCARASLAPVAARPSIGNPCCSTIRRSGSCSIFWVGTTGDWSQPCSKRIGPSWSGLTSKNWLLGGLVSAGRLWTPALQ